MLFDNSCHSTAKSVKVCSSLKADVDHLLDMHIVLQCAYPIMIDNVIRPYQRSQIVKFKKAS